MPFVQAPVRDGWNPCLLHALKAEGQRFRCPFQDARERKVKVHGSPVQLVTGFKRLTLPSRREADILPSAESVALVRGRGTMAQQDQRCVCSPQFLARFVVCGRNALLREFERVMQLLLPDFSGQLGSS